MLQSGFLTSMLIKGHVSNICGYLVSIPRYPKFPNMGLFVSAKNNLVLIAYANSKGLDKPAQMCSLVRAYPTQSEPTLLTNTKYGN